MPRTPWIDREALLRLEPQLSRRGIERYVPQRHEMAQLDHLLLIDAERGLAVGDKHVGPDEFWVRGHVPGRPILPGVLLVEAAAQLCTLFHALTSGAPDRFLALGAIAKARFRGTIVPGDRVILLARARAIRATAALFEVQGVVEGRVVFEGEITGVTV